MTENFNNSSDAARTAEPLKYAKTLRLDDGLTLSCAGEIKPVDICYETYGTLNESASNAVLICHALSGDSHVASHNNDDSEGWWEHLVGSGKYIDTDKYFVICSNTLGGCRGTTGPASINPDTQKPWGPDFPAISIADMVTLQKRLVEHLGIKKLLAVIGGSMGGQQALTWPVLFPDMVEATAVIASTARLSSQALAFDIVGRNAILNDLNFAGGNYYGRHNRPVSGLAIARMIGHVTYLSREAMRQKFDDDRLAARKISDSFEQDFAVGSYLGYQGIKFVERFDANSYLVLSRAMDMFDPAADSGSLPDVFKPARCRWLVLSFSSDWLFSPAESQDITAALVSAGKQVSYCNVESSSGHDAFLLESEISRFGPAIEGFLAQAFADVADESDAAANPANPAGIQTSPVSGSTDATNIFHPDHPQRLDYGHILKFITPQSSALDLGCGCGELLELLAGMQCTRLMGLELNEQAIVECVRRGLNVLQADLNNGLGNFTDKQFDFAILSHTLQSIRDVDELLGEMLRVAGKCIVSFPNFAYHKLSEMLAKSGRAPVSGGILHYNWYDTPNRRFFTIADFEDFCSSRDIQIHETVFLDTERESQVFCDVNTAADMAIFVLSKS